MVAAGVSAWKRLFGLLSWHTDTRLMSGKGDVPDVDTQHTLMSKMRGFDLIVIVGWPSTYARVWEWHGPHEHSYSAMSPT